MYRQANVQILVSGVGEEDEISTDWTRPSTHSAGRARRSAANCIKLRH